MDTVNKIEHCNHFVKHIIETGPSASSAAAFQLKPGAEKQHQKNCQEQNGFQKHSYSNLL